MSKTTLRAGTVSPFAHLLSAIRPGGRRAEQDENKPDQEANRAEDGDNDPQEDEEARKARRAEEDERRQEEDARRAEEDERREQEDARRAEEDEPNPSDENKSGKKGKKAEDGDDDQDGDDDEEIEAKAEDDDDDDNMCRARTEGFDAAQARGRLIFSSPAAAKRPDVAAHLAFSEKMPSAKAIAMLEMAANGEVPASGSKLARRMARLDVPNPGPGGSGAGAKDKSFGQLALEAGRKAGIYAPAKA